MLSLAAVRADLLIRRLVSVLSCLLHWRLQ